MAAQLIRCTHQAVGTQAGGLAQCTSTDLAGTDQQQGADADTRQRQTAEVM
jgi:hypothetical protein